MASMDIHGYLRAHPTASADLVKALLRAESLEAPRAAVDAFIEQKRTASKRGIPFEFLFADWWTFWSVDDRWSRRGRGKGALVMARFGDVGPYAPGNVYCATPAQNQAESRRPARPVETPMGRFDSAKVAAGHFGITADAARRRALNAAKGWRYADAAD